MNQNRMYIKIFLLTLAMIIPSQNSFAVIRDHDTVNPNNNPQVVEESPITTDDPTTLTDSATNEKLDTPFQTPVELTLVCRDEICS